MKNMQTEGFHLSTTSTKPLRKRLMERLCLIIIYLAFAVIIILAIPMCLFLGAIVTVWSAADKIVKVIQKYSQ